MKRLTVILFTLLLLTGCTAPAPNAKQDAKTTVESSEEWNALFASESFRNVTITRDGLAFSGKETLKRDGSVLYLSGSYEGNDEEYCQFYYDGDPYITMLQKDLGAYYASLISKEDTNEYGDYLSAIIFPLYFSGLYEKAEYSEEKDAYQLPYELGEMALDATVYVEDGRLVKLTVAAEDSNIMSMTFTDYQETSITETPGKFTVDEDGWNKAVVFDGSVPFNMYENSYFQNEEYIYNLQCRPYAIAMQQFGSGYLADMYVYYGVENGVTNGQMSIYDYTNNSYYNGSEEAQIDVVTLMNTLVDNFTLNYRYANAVYNDNSHTYTFDVSRYGEDATITLVFLDGKLLTMRNDKAGGDWIESHYSYDNLEEVSLPE